MPYTLTAQSWVEATADALKAAVAEHGRPNTFSPGELSAYYGAPAAMWIGHVFRNRMYEVWQLLGGRDGWGSCPRYEDGRVAV